MSYVEMIKVLIHGHIQNNQALPNFDALHSNIVLVAGMCGFSETSIEALQKLYQQAWDEYYSVHYETLDNI